MTEALLLRPAAAALLAVSRSRLYELASRREVPGCLRLGGTLRIHAPTLKAWLAEQAGDGQKRAAGATRPTAPEVRDATARPPTAG